jgi:hypothetical protein
MLKALQDPRAADALAAYIATNPHPHWKTEAAFRLAEIGDVRSVPTMGWRLTQDPTKLYSGYLYEDLRRNDDERVVSARMIADLAVLHPDKRAEILANSEKGVIAWLEDRVQPHANGMRALVASGTTGFLPKLRAWANPSEKLPEKGAQKLSDGWITAQSALRYIGWAKDAQSWSVLEKQLSRRPTTIDATKESLMQGGLAILGMTLRGLAVGASYGFAQWGDAKAYAPLVKHIEDPLNNEEGRTEACFSLAWVATDDQMKEVAKKVLELSKPDPKTTFIRRCYLETLVRKPVPAATAGLIELLKPEADLPVRHQAARAIAVGGVSKAVAAQMFEKMKEPALRADAALVLLVGGEPDDARRALALYNDAKPEELEELKAVYSETFFGYYSDRSFEAGELARWITNAEAVRHVRVGGAFQEWPRAIISRSMQGIKPDQGPHSLTEVQLRVRLDRAARSKDDKQRNDAITVLKFMKEKGVLMALRGEPEPLGSMARQAFFEVMNPKPVSESLPQAPGSK